MKRNLWISLVLVAVVMLFGSIGCVKPNAEPVERAVVNGAALLEKGYNAGMQNINMQTLTTDARGTLISPKYRTQVVGGMFSGFIGQAEVQLEGVTATLGINIVGTNQGTLAPGVTTRPSNTKDATGEPVADGGAE